MDNQVGLRTWSALSLLCFASSVTASEWVSLSCEPKEPMFGVVSVQLNEELGRLRYKDQEVAAVYTENRITFAALNLKNQLMRMYLDRVTGGLGFDGSIGPIWRCSLVTRRF
jgi:hypothetical protein